MRLVVKKEDQIINEFQFAQGPIHIGRHAGSQIFLPDKTVSRHHAVFYATTDGQWYIQDLDSANKTFLNDEEIKKSLVKTGDIVKVNEYTIEINLEDETIAGEPINLEDTLTKTVYGIDGSPEPTRSPLELQIITRRFDMNYAADIKMPSKRVRDFVQATEMICRTNGLDDILKALINIGIRQFSCLNVWASLRHEPQTPMITHAGKNRDGTMVKVEDIKLKDKIDFAIEKKRFLLFPRIPYSKEKIRLNSAMIAPIVGLGGCFGVLYIDNAPDHEHYSLSDLDYLMMVAIHASVIIENF